MSLNSINQLRNTSIQLIDTTVRIGDLLDRCYMIAEYAEKLKNDIDSLVLIVAQKDSVLVYADAIYYAQLKRDTAQSKTFYKLRNLYTDLETDYDNIKPKFLRPALGGGFDMRYSLPGANINGGGVALDFGLMVNERWLVLLDVGFDVQRNGLDFDVGVPFGFRTILIFK